MSLGLPSTVRNQPPVASSARLSAAVHNGERVAALNAEGLLEGDPEPIFDRFARLAARVADTPTALVSVVTDDRQHFAGLCGVAQPWADARQTPLSHSFCQHVVANAAPLVIEDARRDPILSTNLAIVDLDVIAYAGFPIVSPTGHVLGSMCAIDSEPRVWEQAQLESLADIALLVGNELERRDLVRRLAIDARCDALTGMANRRAWDEELPSALRRAERLGHPLSVVLIDLDHFKGYNDRYGHPAGDAVLREVGARWRGQLRDIDLLARIGGEEFGLLLPGCDAQAALEIVNRLRADIPEGLTASAGIVAWAIPLTAEQFVAEADRALYRAKSDGRDRAYLASSLGS
ncbi:MAG TPA: sensor domain-containing diguanylate cyclase [Solirubrobacteraceae bacterium]|nr:sensor domain-containing diguanylate cyclase [Solirubrobacteraceae bacterium]